MQAAHAKMWDNTSLSRHPQRGVRPPLEKKSGCVFSSVAIQLAPRANARDRDAGRHELWGHSDASNTRRLNLLNAVVDPDLGSQLAVLASGSQRDGSDPRTTRLPITTGSIGWRCRTPFPVCTKVGTPDIEYRIRLDSGDTIDVREILKAIAGPTLFRRIKNGSDTLGNQESPNWVEKLDEQNLSQLNRLAKFLMEGSLRTRLVER